MKIRAILLNERPVGCSAGDGTRMDTDWTRIFLGKYYKLKTSEKFSLELFNRRSLRLRRDKRLVRNW